MAYPLNQPRRVGSLTPIAPRETHVGGAARDGGGAKGLRNQSGQSEFLRRDLPFDAQVADGSAVHRPEGGDVSFFAGIPVERERVALPVERAFVREDIAQHHDLRAEVHIGRQLGVEAVFAVFHALAERLPVGGRGDVEGAGHGYVHALVFRYGRVGGEVAEVERVSQLRVVVVAEEFLCGGQRAVDALPVVGVARGHLIAVVVELHLIHPFLGVGGGQRLKVGAERLSPDVVGAVALQHLRHFAARELLLDYPLALCLAAGVEVVAVVERGGGAGGIGRGEGVTIVVAVVRIVRAGVEAAGQRAGAVLAIYEAAHAFLSFLGGGVDRALDEAVADGDVSTRVYIGNQASSPASVAGIAARDVHRADAVRDGVAAAIGFVNQSRQIETVRPDGAFGAQVPDGGAIHSPEGGDVVIFAAIPVELQRVALAVERAGIGLFGSSHHRDVGAEVHVLRQLGVEGGLSAVHEGAELLPVGGRGDGEGASHGYVHALVFRYGRGGGEVAEVERVSHLRVVARTEEFLCCGQRDGLSAVGVAHGLYLAVVDELYLVHPLLGVGGELRLVVGAEGLSPHLRLYALLQLIGYVAVLQLRLGDLIALHFAAGVEVVAVGEGGAVAGFRAEGVAESIVGGVVLADVEAASQRVGATIIKDKAGHRSLAFIRIVGDAAFDEAVGDMNRGLVATA